MSVPMADFVISRALKNFTLIYNYFPLYIFNIYNLDTDEITQIELNKSFVLPENGIIFASLDFHIFTDSYILAVAYNQSLLYLNNDNFDWTDGGSQTMSLCIGGDINSPNDLTVTINQDEDNINIENVNGYGRIYPTRKRGSYTKEDGYIDFANAHYFNELNQHNTNFNGISSIHDYNDTDYMFISKSNDNAPILGVIYKGAMYQPSITSIEKRVIDDINIGTVINYNYVNSGIIQYMVNIVAEGEISITNTEA